LYYPLGVVDLRYGVGIEESKSRELGFKIHLEWEAAAGGLHQGGHFNASRGGGGGGGGGGERKTYYFLADTEASKREWMGLIRDMMFRVRRSRMMTQDFGAVGGDVNGMGGCDGEEEDVRVVLPLECLREVEVVVVGGGGSVGGKEKGVAEKIGNLGGSQSGVRDSYYEECFKGTLRLRIVDEELCVSEEYYFAYFNDVGKAYRVIKELWEAYKERTRREEEDASLEVANGFGAEMVGRKSMDCENGGDVRKSFSSMSSGSTDTREGGEGMGDQLKSMSPVSGVSSSLVSSPARKMRRRSIYDSTALSALPPKPSTTATITTTTPVSENASRSSTDFIDDRQKLQSAQASKPIPPWVNWTFPNKAGATPSSPVAASSASSNINNTNSSSSASTSTVTPAQQNVEADVRPNPKSLQQKLSNIDSSHRPPLPPNPSSSAFSLIPPTEPSASISAINLIPTTSTDHPNLTQVVSEPAKPNPLLRSPTSPTLNPTTANPTTPTTHNIFPMMSPTRTWGRLNRGSGVQGTPPHTNNIMSSNVAGTSVASANSISPSRSFIRHRKSLSDVGADRSAFKFRGFGVSNAVGMVGSAASGGGGDGGGTGGAELSRFMDEAKSAEYRSLFALPDGEKLLACKFACPNTHACIKADQRFLSFSLHMLSRSSLASPWKALCLGELHLF
jgi:hypothetical protein